MDEDLKKLRGGATTAPFQFYRLDSGREVACETRRGETYILSILSIRFSVNTPVLPTTPGRLYFQFYRLDSRGRALFVLVEAG